MAAAAVIGAGALVPGSASAQPGDASDGTTYSAPEAAGAIQTTGDAVERLQTLSRTTEKVTERYHAAQDKLNERQAELDKATTQQREASKAAERARADQVELRKQVDRLTSSSFEGTQVHQLSALLVSDSPQNFLDQMSALDVIASDNKEAVRKLAQVREEAEKAEQTAQQAERRAAEAKQRAEQIRGEAEQRKGEMEQRVAEVKQRLAELNAAEREQLASPGVTDPSAAPQQAQSGPQDGADDAAKQDPSSQQASTPGDSTDSPEGDTGPSSHASSAVQAAMSKLGQPYEYGATGPNTFDCSGLMQWAYQQVGKSIPRSSSAQASSGTPVSKSELQPGDLVFSYTPVSHVGMYVGDGKIIHSPHSGDVVKISPMKYLPYNSARRY